jgi:hypothetical protein
VSKCGFVTAINQSNKERGSVYRFEKGPTTEDSAAFHSDAAQTDVTPLLKTTRREAKPKASRRAA